MEALRRSRRGDEKELFSLWKSVFGDPDAYIADFFSYMYWPGDAVCLIADGRIVSMAFSLPIGRLIGPDGKKTPCSYIYAVATLPEYRSRGYGTRVTCAAAENCALAVLRPAEPSLFGYYKRSTGFSEFFSFREQCYVQGSIAPASRERAMKIASSEYSELRESLLSDTIHISLSKRALIYQEHLCTSSGGGLFRLQLPCGEGVFASEKHRGEVFVKELLCKEEDEIKALTLIASAYSDAKKITVRMPVKNPDNSNNFAMITPPVCPLKDGAPPWFGFAFD